MTNEDRDSIREAQLSIFVPANQAAICADSMCGGVFLLSAGKCPGCGSRHWVLLQSAAPVARIEGEASE